MEQAIEILKGGKLVMYKENNRSQRNIWFMHFWWYVELNPMSSVTCCTDKWLNYHSSSIAIAVYVVMIFLQNLVTLTDLTVRSPSCHHTPLQLMLFLCQLVTQLFQNCFTLMLNVGGFALFIRPITFSLVVSTSLLGTCLRLLSTAATICGTGIFLGAGAKFNPFDRTDFCGLVRSLVTTHLSSWTKHFLCLTSIDSFNLDLHCSNSLSLWILRPSHNSHMKTEDKRCFWIDSVHFHWSCSPEMKASLFSCPVSFEGP